jgi:hypothetical protein
VRGVVTIFVIVNIRIGVAMRSWGSWIKKGRDAWVVEERECGVAVGAEGRGVRGATKGLKRQG